MYKCTTNGVRRHEAIVSGFSHHVTTFHWYKQRRINPGEERAFVPGGKL